VPKVTGKLLLLHVEITFLVGLTRQMCLNALGYLWISSYVSWLWIIRRLVTYFRKIEADNGPAVSGSVPCLCNRWLRDG